MSRKIKNTSPLVIGKDHGGKCAMIQLIREGYWFNTKNTQTCIECGVRYVLWSFSKGGHAWCLEDEYPHGNPEKVIRKKLNN